MATQLRNDDLINLLRPDVQMRYESNFAHKSACSLFQALPALRGFWPMSSVGVSGQAIDLQGLGNHLTLNGNPQFDFSNLIPYCAYDGTGDYHNITDAASGNAFDVSGTEAFVNTNGMTMGCWFYPEETGTLENTMGKHGNAGARSYVFAINVGNNVSFIISDDGTNTDNVTSAVITFNAWHFVVGRFIPSSSVDIFIDNVESNQATARASLFNTATNFEIGARNAGTNPYQGRIAFAFICAAALSNPLIGTIYHQSRAMFDV